jgi:hypothetical protein
MQAVNSTKTKGCITRSFRAEVGMELTEGERKRKGIPGPGNGRSRGQETEAVECRGRCTTEEISRTKLTP